MFGKKETIASIYVKMSESSSQKSVDTVIDTKSTMSESGESKSPQLTSADEITLFKQEKAIKKCAFTKVKNKLLLELEEDNPSRRKLRQFMCTMAEAEEAVIVVMRNLCDANLKLDNQETVEKVSIEMEQFQSDYEKIETMAQEYLDSRCGDESSITSSKVEQS